MQYPIMDSTLPQPKFTPEKITQSTQRLQHDYTNLIKEVKLLNHQIKCKINQQHDVQQNKQETFRALCHQIKNNMQTLSKLQQQYSKYHKILSSHSILLLGQQVQPLKKMQTQLSKSITKLKLQLSKPLPTNYEFQTTYSTQITKLQKQIFQIKKQNHKKQNHILENDKQNAKKINQILQFEDYLNKIDKSDIEDQTQQQHILQKYHQLTAKVAKGLKIIQSSNRKYLMIYNKTAKEIQDINNNDQQLRTTLRNILQQINTKKQEILILKKSLKLKRVNSVISRRATMISKLDKRIYTEKEQKQHIQTSKQTISKVNYYQSHNSELRKLKKYKQLMKEKKYSKIEKLNFYDKKKNQLPININLSLFQQVSKRVENRNKLSFMTQVDIEKLIY